MSRLTSFWRADSSRNGRRARPDSGRRWQGWIGAAQSWVRAETRVGRVPALREPHNGHAGLFFATGRSVGQNRGLPAAGSVNLKSIHFGQPQATATPVTRVFANRDSIFLTAGGPHWVPASAYTLACGAFAAQAVVVHPHRSILLSTHWHTDYFAVLLKASQTNRIVTWFRSQVIIISHVLLGSSSKRMCVVCVT